MSTWQADFDGRPRWKYLQISRTSQTYVPNPLAKISPLKLLESSIRSLEESRFSFPIKYPSNVQHSSSKA
ncbi:hypothetical protein PanWU01x14_212810 [Parasponia andersonii]|uniref:Uncharacterized protein n=1 Tax=Parasponia andersonii TaxID=3476 RepID=A0A2P5BSV1_PARAD|nr:hypothetical protein PanWU01x14_212810 [Parasponia andersonii]